MNTTHFDEIEHYLQMNLPKRIRETHIPNIHYATKFTWGQEVIVPVEKDKDGAWKYKNIGKIDSWIISLPIYENTDPKTLLDCFLASAHKIEMQNFDNFVLNSLLDKSRETIAKEATCCQLLDWRFLPRDESTGSIISDYGNIALVKYAMYTCIPEEYIRVYGVEDDE